MKKILTQPLIAASSLAVLLVPYIANAQIKYKFESFIKPKDFNGLLVSILEFLIVIATPIVVLFIIYSGFMYVTARGNAQQVGQATRSLTYAIIGGVLIIGAVAISVVIKNLVGAFTP